MTARFSGKVRRSPTRIEKRAVADRAHSQNQNIRVGVDTGGTFTDFVVIRDGRIEIFKEFSTPGEPEAAILRGLARLAPGKPAEVIHGSTVATNALLERKGARVA